MYVRSFQSCHLLTFTFVVCKRKVLLYIRAIFSCIIPLETDFTYLARYLSFVVLSLKLGNGNAG